MGYFTVLLRRHDVCLLKRQCLISYYDSGRFKTNLHEM